jgi:hexosaminidase
MKGNSCFFYIAVLILYCIPLNAGINIVPKPKEIEYGKKTFTFNPLGVKIQVATAHPESLKIALDQLTDAVFTELNHTDQAPDIMIGIPNGNAAIREIAEKEGLWPDERIGREGYVLSVKPGGILLVAHTHTGLFYGVQTIRQIIRGSDAPGTIPELKIIDWPDLRYRGMMDDISRGPVPTMDYMKYQIRRLAELKINMLSYYTEHVVATRSHGDFAPAGGALTIEEWKELSDYALRYHIELVGNFQSLGHFEKILAYPQYAPLGTTDRMLSPVNPESFKLLQDIYKEMVPVFSAPFFNANCDETWDLGRGDTKKAVDSLGVARVYSDHINRIYAEVKKYGKRLWIWGDIILDHPEILDMIPRDILLGAWDYGASDSFDSFFRPFKTAGFDFMFSCGVLNSGRIMPDYQMTRTNIHNFVRDGLNAGALGMLNTVWDDGGTALFALDWYGVAYAADQSWYANDDDQAAFDKRFDLGIYGDKKNKLGDALRILGNLTDLTPTQEMNASVFWKTLIPERGKKLQIGLNEWDDVLENVWMARKFLDESEVAVYEQDLLYLNFVLDQYEFMATARRKLLEISDSYSNACRTQNEPATVRSYLISALLQLNSIRQMWTDLEDNYTHLWLLENRSYWLDHIQAEYDTKKSDLVDAGNLLSSALNDFDQGHYLPPPSEVRLAIEGVSGQYFQFWLLCGPFPNAGGKGRKTDYLVPMGGEAQARPVPGMEFSTLDGREERWFKYDSPLYSEIDLSSVFEDNTSVVAYAYCRIESPDKRRVRATFGSNDGIQIILNGKKILEKEAKRSLIPDEDEVQLDLEKGKNDLLLKIDQNKGAWGFSFRLPDVNIRHHKQKYKIVE